MFRINEELFFAGILVLVFVSYLISPAFILFTGVLAPLAALLLFRAGHYKLTYIHLALLLVFIVGAFFGSFHVTLYYILSVILPPYIIVKSMRVRGFYPWFGLAFSCLPLFIAAAALIAPFETRELISVQLTMMIDKSFEPVIAREGILSLPEKTLAFYNNRAEIAKYLTGLFPAFVYMYSTVILYFSERYFYRIVPRQILKLPDFFLALLIIGGICVVLKQERLLMPGLNILLCTGLFFFFRGLDILRYHMIRFNVFPVVRILLYIFILFYPVLALLVAVFGFMSLYFDLMREPEDGNNEGTKQI